MISPTTYSASCHCGAIRFTFRCEEITRGCRCNCSFCIRKGAVMSNYIRPSDVEVDGLQRLALYQFGDRDLNHWFCRACGIFPFTTVASVPPDYQGPARPGDYRINLGCVHDLDVLGLEIQAIDGKAL
jgi:hypothetical protein